jgi:hypothetical protein
MLLTPATSDHHAAAGDLSEELSVQLCKAWRATGCQRAGNARAAPRCVSLKFFQYASGDGRLE